MINYNKIRYDDATKFFGQKNEFLHSSKKLGEHVFEMYAMLYKTILHTQVYYQLNLYSLPMKYTKKHDGFTFIYRTQTEMSK